MLFSFTSSLLDLHMPQQLLPYDRIIEAPRAFIHAHIEPKYLYILQSSLYQNETQMLYIS
jgi:hypothetical protein